MFAAFIVPSVELHPAHVRVCPPETLTVISGLLQAVSMLFQSVATVVVVVVVVEGGVAATLFDAAADAVPPRLARDPVLFV